MKTWVFARRLLNCWRILSANPTAGLFLQCYVRLPCYVPEGKIEVMADSNFLDGDKLEQALRNTRSHSNIVLVPQIEFTVAQVRTFKEFYEDFLNTPPNASEAKALVKEFEATIQVLINEVKSLTGQASHYPFLKVLSPVLVTLQQLKDKSYVWYLTDFVEKQVALLEIKTATIEPVRSFMNGSQKNIYDNTRQFMQTQKFNFNYIEDDTAAQIERSLNDPDCYKDNRMQRVKTQMENLRAKVTKQIDEERTQAKVASATLRNRMCSMPEFSVLNTVQQESLTRPFNDFTVSVEDQDLIAVIRDSLRCFEETIYTKLLSQMTSWAQSLPDNAPVSDSGNNNTTDEVPSWSTIAEPRIEYVPSQTVRVSFDKPWLADETDVDSYLKSMREALLVEINNGKRIQI